GPALGKQTATVPRAPLSATVPEGMPSHFAFGLMNAPGDVGLMNDMRAQNGTAWDLRYVALTGGVTGGHGWETLGSPAGAYAVSYADDSAANRYTPAFAYEELAQTVGSCKGCGARQADLRNLNDPAIMAAYFANWRLLMQRLGAFGRPALVIVEPGLWGYLQQAAYNQGNTASAIPAAVASSSDQDATGMPNTAQGFAWTLLHIRDRYAPNAIMTLHFSNWSTGSDINSSPSVALDVSGVAARTTQFLNSAGLASTPSGVSTWDLLSNDVSGQDSGQGAVWWDATNKTFPNFARYLQFVALVSHETGRKVVLWQVPEGNQYFDTMDNSAHHTQDNRAQYLLAHVADFANAGVIAALFGTGGGGTTVDDAAGDGVTNPTPIISFGCDRCDNHVSAYADDDGGFLRIFVGAYYRHGPLKLASPQSWTPPPAPGSAIATPLPAGVCVGTPIARVGQTSATPNPVGAGSGVSVTTTITLNCDTSVLLDVEIDSNQGRVVHMTQDNVAFQQNRPRTLTVQGVVPVGTPAGAYVIKIGVFEAGWGALEGWSDGSAALVVR
ncbi:MAG TPA: hypothetical protein VGR88_08530, partial [Ktedonobacterales bacterium]|nr:hypothetical protein [Ktedonobacterales bacterium]